MEALGNSEEAYPASLTSGAGQQARNLVKRNRNVRSQAQDGSPQFTECTLSAATIVLANVPAQLGVHVGLLVTAGGGKYERKRSGVGRQD